MENFHYYKPKKMEDVRKLVGEINGEITFLGGGTDLFPGMKQETRSVNNIIDLKGVHTLDSFEIDEDENVRIGANMTLSEILDSNVLPKSLGLVAEALCSIGSPQIRNRATLVGNICNASPAADSLPPLICLRAILKVEDGTGSRRIDIEEFFKGPGQTILKRGEVVTEVVIPIPSQRSYGSFIKLGRVAKDLATVNIAILIGLEPDGVTCSDAKIALGAVGPTVLLVKECEDLLIEKNIHEVPSELIAEIAGDSSKPIDDVRATASYRRKMVRVLTKRALSKTLTSIRSQ